MSGLSPFAPMEAYAPPVVEPQPPAKKGRGGVQSKYKGEAQLAQGELKLAQQMIEHQKTIINKYEARIRDLEQQLHEMHQQHSQYFQQSLQRSHQSHVETLQHDNTRMAQLLGCTIASHMQTVEQLVKTSRTQFLPPQLPSEQQIAQIVEKEIQNSESQYRVITPDFKWSPEQRAKIGQQTKTKIKQQHMSTFLNHQVRDAASGRKYLALLDQHMAQLETRVKACASDCTKSLACASASGADANSDETRLVLSAKTTCDEAERQLEDLKTERHLLIDGLAKMEAVTTTATTQQGQSHHEEKQLVAVS